MQTDRLIKLLREALLILEKEAKPKGPDPSQILESAILGTVQKSRVWTPLPEIYKWISNHLMEELEPTDHLKIGKLMKKLKFEKKVRKINQKLITGYYVTRKITTDTETGE